MPTVKSNCLIFPDLSAAEALTLDLWPLWGWSACCKIRVIDDTARGKVLWVTSQWESVDQHRLISIKKNVIVVLNYRQPQILHFWSRFWVPAFCRKLIKPQISALCLFVMWHTGLHQVRGKQVHQSSSRAARIEISSVSRRIWAQASPVLWTSSCAPE